MVTVHREEFSQNQVQKRKSIKIETIISKPIMKTTQQHKQSNTKTSKSENPNSGTIHSDEQIWKIRILRCKFTKLKQQTQQETSIKQETIDKPTNNQRK
jgi:hypothetical protein